MKAGVSSERMECKLRKWLVSMLAFTALFAVGGQSAAFAETLQANPAGKQLTPGVANTGEPEAKLTTPAGTAASRVYKDPVTGKMGAPPVEALPAEVPVEMKEALSTSSAGLVETLGATAAGGVKLDLEGRFRSLMTATKDSDGKTAMRCLSNTPISMQPNPVGTPQAIPGNK